MFSIPWRLNLSKWRTGIGSTPTNLVPELRLLEALEVAVVLAVDLAVAGGALVVGALGRFLVPSPVQERGVK